MKKIGVLKGAALGLACMGMMIPQQTFAAGPVTAQVASKVQIADVTLTKGTLSGKVVDAQGQVVGGSVVKVSLGNQEVATTVTNKEGEFAVGNLNTGIYQVAAGDSRASVRLWDAQVAPPSAKSNVLIVTGSTVRAQGPLGTNGTLLIVGGGIIIAGTTIAIIESNDDDAPASP
ncbi:MAG: carboxypeptidase regulatory-like domain-containing protein [Planctomycetaceae bacterium]|nr:carboxypeptidase regulatory-like domain-containing protein [Planctomycetaceae bacterium]